jgi:hypothetical protein
MSHVEFQHTEWKEIGKLFYDQEPTFSVDDFHFKFSNGPSHSQ